jgi:hypothetical protein
MNAPFEPVHAVDDYYDGPRTAAQLLSGHFPGPLIQCQVERSRSTSPFFIQPIRLLSVLTCSHSSF